MADNSGGGEIGPISPLWGGVKTVNGAGGLAVKGAMRPTVVVVLAPVFDNYFGFL